MIRSILSWPLALCAIAFAAAPAAHAQRLDIYNMLRAQITEQVYADLDGGVGYGQGVYSPLSSYSSYYESQLEQFLERKLAGMSQAELIAFRDAAERAHYSNLATTSNPGYYRAKAMQKRAMDAVLDRLIARAGQRSTPVSSSTPRATPGVGTPGVSPSATPAAPVWQRYPDGYMRTFYNGQWWIYDNGVVRADR